MRWVIEDEGNKKMQSNFTQDLVKLVTQGQVKSSQSHHNFMSNIIIKCLPPFSGMHISLNFFNAVFVYCFCLAKNNLILFRLGAYNLD